MLVITVNQPSHYAKLLLPITPELHFITTKDKLADIIHLFITTTEDLENYLPVLKHQIVQNGIILVSWPRSIRERADDLDEHKIRKCALAKGLVDNKVCAVDERWSGLKLVIPLKDRIRHRSELKASSN